MSVLGIGVVAGVAATSLQARQAGRQQAREAHDRTHLQQRLREVRDTRLKGLEEDDGEAETQLHVDGELPEHEHHDPPPDHEKQRDQAAAAASDDFVPGGEAIAETAATTYGPPRAGMQSSPSTRHRLDVQA